VLTFHPQKQGPLLKDEGSEKTELRPRRRVLRGGLIGLGAPDAKGERRGVKGKT